MATDTVIEAQGLTVTYGDFTAVSDVSLSVRRGELYALLGTNGAGKTSTLETLEGLRAPARGMVRLFGTDPRERALVRRRTGIMLQESGFAADLTCRETVALLGSLTGREDEPDRLLRLAGLHHKRDTRAGQLSGGEKHRLDFASAAYGSPALLFLDEPTAGLDVAARDELWTAVSRLREAGTTVLLTTHYLPEAQEQADRIGVLHEGRLVAEGTMTQLAAAMPATIAFLPPRAGGPLPLPIARRDGQLAVIETETLQRDLTLLLQWADAQSVELERLAATAGTLDDLFRFLTADAGGPETKEAPWVPSLAAN